VLAVVALLGTVWTGLADASQGAVAADTESSWTVYHGDASGSGVSASVTTVDTSAPAWTSPTLDGQLYGEPLVFGGDVYVGTENNTVYALSSSTGAVVWSHHIASPVPASSLPCGDITPNVGITGTPVIDPSRSELFVVADELVQGVPAHMLVGLSTSAGTVEMTQNVDPPGAKPAALLQRTGLTLDAGRVVFALGGNFGDCSTYRGRVGAVSETGETPSFFTVDAAAGQSQGAIWMGGAAPAVDASGNIWVTAGNGSVTSAGQPYDDSDAALELSPSLQLLQYFAPTTWAQDNADDLDLSVEPTLLSNGQVVISGKSRIIDLLDGTHLGGIGGEETSLASGCAQTVDGGSAVVGTTVYLPCLSGPIAVQIGTSPAALTLLWRAAVGGGPPIVAAGRVWTIGQDGTLYGLDPTTGKAKQQASIGVPANHFPTPSVGDGLLLAASATHVVAFHATTASSTTTTPSTTSGSSTTTSSTATAVPAPTSKSGGGGGLSGGVIAAIVAAGVLLLGGIAWVIRRRTAANRA
jgi:outer membrane protein assembly factor BamB